MGTRVPWYRPVPTKFQNMGTAGYRVPTKFQVMPTPGEKLQNFASKLHLKYRFRYMTHI